MWSVREHAGRRGITASTINRAYRCLAEHKVIVLGDRRRARVAPDGALTADLARRMLWKFRQIYRFHQIYPDWFTTSCPSQASRCGTARS